MQRQFGWHVLFLHAWYEFRILADPNSYRGQEENSFAHAVWPVSFLADAVWTVKCTSDLPACNALGPGRTDLGVCHRLLEWHQCDGQNVQPGIGKPRDRAQAIQEIRPEAEAPKVCIVMHWNQVPWEEEWCQQCSCDCRSHPDSYGLAKTKESEGAGEFSWFCELPQRVHVWSSREVVSSVSTDSEWVWGEQHTVQVFEKSCDRTAHSGFPQLTWPVYPGYWCIGCCNRGWVESGSGGQGANHLFR